MHFGCELGHLAPRFFLRAGTIDGVSRVAEFFLGIELRGEAAFCFGFRQATGDEARELLFRRAAGDHQAVKLLVKARFDEQSGFHENNIAISGTLPFAEFSQHGFFDTRVQDGVEFFELTTIGEDETGQLAAMDAAAIWRQRGAEFLQNFPVGGLAGFHKLVTHGVGIENREAQFAQNRGYGAFAGGDSAGESEF